MGMVGEHHSLTISLRFLLELAIAVVILSDPFVAARVGPECRTGPVLFNFGDSNSDTGGLIAGLGILLGPPYSRLFRHPTGRLCDGRLVIDFLCESLNTSYLNPYLEALGSDFSNGANFAIAGATTLPRDLPFSLFIQVKQFLHFRSRSLELIEQGSTDLIDEEGFQKALYTIDIGQNDLAAAFSLNYSYDQIITRISSILSEIRNAIEAIYDYGGKNFWVHNTGPLGCLPQELSVLRIDDGDLDPYGCLMTLNNAAKEFNSGLIALCNELSSELKNATIVYTDIYAIKYDLIANYTKYGFESSLMACCGYGGPPYNLKGNTTCGYPGFQVCEEGSQYISWDGVHYTEAANAIIASKILSTEFSKPSLDFGYFFNSRSSYIHLINPL